MEHTSIEENRGDIDCSDSQRPRVVFVDDEKNILRGIRRLIVTAEHDWDVYFFNNALEARDFLEEESCDVLVADYAMPNVTGLELVKRQNEISPRTQCIFLTGKADLRIATQIINTVQVFRMLTKPSEDRDLLRAIKAAIAQVSEEPGRHDSNITPSFDELLSLLSTGVALLSKTGLVIYANQAALKIISEKDGLLVAPNGELRTYDGSLSRTLQSMSEVESGGQNENVISALSIDRPNSGGTLKMIFIPSESSRTQDEQNIFAFITDPHRAEPLAPSLLSRLFNFTYREAQVASAMINGARTEEIAAEMGVTLSSARTYVKRVMAKTGTNRQQDLIRLLLNSPSLNK